MRNHGSGQACRKERRTPACEECHAYARERLRTEGRTPGTHRYQSYHGQGMAGARYQDRKRRWERKQHDAADRRRLEELWAS